MKIATLNVWGGKIHEPLVSFVMSQKDAVDVFCFQELVFGKNHQIILDGVRENIFFELAGILRDFVPYVRYAPEGSYFEGQALEPGLRIGQAIFVRNSIPVVSEGGLYAYLPRSVVAKTPSITITGNFQYVTLGLPDKNVLIGNLHGLWQAAGKGDTEDRLTQSKILATFLKKDSSSKIICGDFNMLPETESMRMLEIGMRNLIKEYNVSSTRSSLYEKDIPFSDYFLLSPDLAVRDFKTLDVVVSDHLPLFLECE